MRKIAAQRARRFCQVLHEEAQRRRPAPWWMSVDDVARRLELPFDEAAELALHCIEHGLVKPSGGNLHSVSLHEAGRHLARRSARRPGRR